MRILCYDRFIKGKVADEYYMLDAQENVVRMIDGNGRLVVEYTYDD